MRRHEFGFASATSAIGPAFDLRKRSVVLNNGVEMPVLGLGTYILSSSQAEESVYAARMAETAHNIPYHNGTSNAGEMFDR